MARIRRQCKSHKELESPLVLITPTAERPSLPSVTALTAAVHGKEGTPARKV